MWDPESEPTSDISEPHLDLSYWATLEAIEARTNGAGDVVSLLGPVLPPCLDI